ncbi:hypothetical protein V8G54_000728 [Vigna mungo]|uniref:Cupin type-1 domain-containing protein n=1 Tax=Vigna mungo TaxID=3915 RepID=A0AAQ3P5X7_VIGMU
MGNNAEEDLDNDVTLRGVQMESEQFMMMEDMVHDALMQREPCQASNSSNVEEALNEETQRFFNFLLEANMPLYEGASNSKLSMFNKLTNGVLCHPCDGEAWKHFGRVNPDFAIETLDRQLGKFVNWCPNIRYFKVTKPYGEDDAEPGDIFIFPKGLIHYQYNPQSVSATAISAFGKSANAGTVSILHSAFSTVIDDVILVKAFNTDTNTISAPEIAQPPLRICSHFLSNGSGLTLLALQEKAGKEHKSFEHDTISLRCFDFKELEKATANFSEDCLLGSGAFGNVYKGTFELEGTLAIKRAHFESFTSVDEFRNG